MLSDRETLYAWKLIERKSDYEKTLFRGEEEKFGPYTTDLRWYSRLYAQTGL